MNNPRRALPALPLALFLAQISLSNSTLAIPTNGVYEVMRGDTLSQIAESKYGNWIKYKDLWRRNEDLVSNPDLILPGQKLRLLSDEEVKFFETRENLYASSNGNPSANNYHYRKRRSDEWQFLPKQEWEHFIFRKAPEMEFKGFDRNSRLGKRINDQTIAPAIIASDRLPIQGEIENARSEFSQIFLGEQVFVRADEQLQVGTTYSVTSGPQKVTSRLDGRVGFAYELTGKIRIVGVRDGVFIGTVIELRSVIQRHQLLLPDVKPLVFPEAVASASAMVGTVSLTGMGASAMVSEQQMVFIDRGSSDGLKPGMIFRHYLHEDPLTHQDIASHDFLIETELMVLDVQDRFSTAIVVTGRSFIKEGDEVVALTDLTDFNRNFGMQTVIQDAGSKPSPDELDQLDQSDGLGEKEDRELHQLEGWNKMESSTPPQSASEGTNPAVNDEIQRANIHSGQKALHEIGEEAAPNDGSSKNTAPPPTPEAAPTQDVPSPAIEPTPTTDVPPPPVDP